MITSASNQKVKNVRALLSSKKERGRQGAFVVEGARLFSEADISLIKEVYISESFYNKPHTGHLSDIVSKKLENTGYEIVSDTVFSKMSDTITPQGILSVVKTNGYKLEELCKDKKKLHIVVLEGLQDPGNLGTILRTAEAAGFEIIIADNNTADVYAPKVTRSTMGSVFRVPVVYTDDLAATLDYLKKLEVMIFAAHLKGEKLYREVDYGNKCALLIGNEGSGLSDEISGKADMLVKIPMHGKVESLNASVAASLLMFEVNV